MQHTINHSVYSESGRPPSLRPGDGIELLTGYSEVDPSAWKDAVSAHLPFVVDWYSVYTGRLKIPDEMSDMEVSFFSYGRDREEIVANVRRCIRCAAPLRPAYGVIHAGSANIRELFCERYTDRDSDVLEAFAEIVNEAVSIFPGGEPPFRLMFENQWWPGLRMLDGSDYKVLRDKIEFENWGLCLDTGHLMVTTQQARDEKQSIDMLMDIFEGYPKDMIDDIKVIHLHRNESAGYIKNYDAPEGIDRMPIKEILGLGYGFVTGMDQHRPFSMKDVRRITDLIRPDFVTHEMGAPEPSVRESDYHSQRSLFI